MSTEFLPTLNTAVLSRDIGEHGQVIGSQLLPSELSLFQAGDYLSLILLHEELCVSLVNQLNSSQLHS